MENHVAPAHSLPQCFAILHLALYGHGAQILYSRYRTSASGESADLPALSNQGADKSSPHEAGSARNEGDPAWTPDGRSIVFGRLPDRMDSGQPKAIYSLNLDTGKVTEVPGSAGLFSPRLSPDGRYIAAMPLDQKALRLFDWTTRRWTTLTAQGVGDPTWSHDGSSIYFQDFLAPGKPIYRISIPHGKPEQVATIDNLRPVSATDYRLIGLAPGDLPMVTDRTPAVNLYEVDLGEK